MNNVKLSLFFQFFTLFIIKVLILPLNIDHRFIPQIFKIKIF